MDEDQMTLTPDENSTDMGNAIENSDVENVSENKKRKRKSKTSNEEKPKRNAKEAKCEVELTPDSKVLTTDDLKLGNDSWSVISIVGKYEKGLLDFGLPQQRAVVWGKDKRSAYIHSILSGLHKFQPTPILNRIGSGKNVKYVVYDGKQRLLGSIISYVNGEFALKGLKNDPLIECDGHYYNINGLRFEQLPQVLKDRLSSANMSVLITDNCNDEIMRFVMLRVNSGEQMSSFDIARIRKADMTDIEQFANHGIFKVMKKLGVKGYSEMVVRTWITLYEEEPKLTGKHINEIMQNLQMTDEQIANIEEIYDTILEAYNILDERGSGVGDIMLNKTRFMDFIPIVEKFDTAEQFADWVEDFFRNMPDDYKELVIGGHTTTPTYRNRRVEIIKQNAEAYLNR